MTDKLVIIGAGHAGSSAAMAAASLRHKLGMNDEISIDIINPSPNLGIRPRYYEYELEKTQVPLHEFLTPLNVNIHVDEVSAIKVDDKEIVTKNSTCLRYDSLIMAAGSQLVFPSITGLEETYNIDTYQAAKQFQLALQKTYLDAYKNNTEFRVAVLGAGITGLELACELPILCNRIAQDYKLPYVPPKIVLMDRHLISASLGGDTESYIKQALDKAKVETISHASIVEIKQGAIYFNELESVTADIIVSSLGMRANVLANELSDELDELGRIEVNDFLQLPEQSYCFAAGDIARAKVDEKHYSVMSCQQGRPQGRVAGYNAIAQLAKRPLLVYVQPNYVTCVDLGEWGAIYTEGWDRKTKKIQGEAKDIKRHINVDRIYPPRGSNLDELLEAGNPGFTTPAQSIGK